MAWSGDSAGHAAAARKGHRGGGRKKSPGGQTYFALARKHHGPVEASEYRSAIAKKAARTRAKNRGLQYEKPIGPKPWYQYKKPIGPKPKRTRSPKK